VTTWLRHYAQPQDAYVVTLRHDDELVAVAPFYRRVRFAAPLASACLQPVGTGGSDRLPLPAHWDDLRRGLKRNVKEGVRRGANRLGRAQLHSTLVEPREEAELPAAIDDLLFLHRRRAGLVGRERHADYFERLADERFMRAATTAMFGEGLASPLVLRVNDSPAAGRLVLRGNRSVFLSFSGIDPAWWNLSPGTTLISEIMKAAIARADSSVNLSLYPEERKLRWSEVLELHNDFLAVAPRRRSRLAFSLYWQLRSMRRSRPARA
jgi:CelD/BcsL family acetyltransferase involved in cellulose biosynthesis